MAPFLLIFFLSTAITGSAAYSNSLASTGGPGRGPYGATIASCLAATTTTSTTNDKGMGLLSGINVVSSKYYSSRLQMDTKEDIAWLMEQGVLWKAAVKDAKERNISPEDYLQDVKMRLLQFYASKEVHDREISYRFLEEMFIPHKYGQLRLLLGGKSVGKSLVLNDFKKKLDKKVGFMALIVDGRDNSGSSVADGILEAYKEYFERTDIAKNDTLKLIQFLGEGLLKGVSGVDAMLDLLKVTSFLDMKKVIKVVGDVLDEATKRESLTGEKALQSFVDAATLLGCRPVLIIDEANKVLGLGDGTSGTSQTLDKIVKLTKQSRKLEVVMASAEYDYPYHLEENGLNLNDISEVLFAGEVPPRSMWELLVTKETRPGNALIGMGKNLAELLIACYGGHCLRIEGAISMLRREKETFAACRKLHVIGQNITLVLEEYPKEGLPLLCQMSRQEAKRSCRSNDCTFEHWWDR